MVISIRRTLVRTIVHRLLSAPILGPTFLMKPRINFRSALFAFRSILTRSVGYGGTLTFETRVYRADDDERRNDRGVHQTER